jgi:rfaE bifunctional protein kinase chain/domain
VRIDRGTRRTAAPGARAAFARAALARVGRVDAVLVSDYGAGLVTPALVGQITRALRGRGRGAEAPVLVDSRYDLGRYHHLTACTPNESEVEALLGVTIDDDPRVLERAGREMLARTGMRIVLITRGSRGMALFEVDQPTRHLAIYGSDEIADVTGAGDTVIATMTLALAAGAAALDAARLANYAGGLVVMKRGTATVSADELSRAIAEDLR